MADADARLIIELEAKIDKLAGQLSKANAAVFGAAGKMEKDLGKANAQWEKLFGKYEPAKALDNVFSRARLGLIEEGGTRIGLFGQALEDLGPAGIAAGAALATVAVAAEQAIKAAEWAEDLEKASKKIGVSTVALQEFDFAATASGVGVDTFREALSGLNEKIGQVQSGIARAQTTKVFEALGLSPDELRRLGTVQEILPRIADALAKLPAAEREGLAARLDIASILPALEKGGEGLAELSAEAHKFGIIADADLIKKAAAASEKLHIAGDIVDKELKVAFANLATPIANVATRIAEATNAISKFIGECGDALEPIARLVDAIKRIPGVQSVEGAVNGYLDFQAHGGILRPIFDGLAQRGRNDKLRAGINALDAGAPANEEFRAEYQDTFGGATPASKLIPDKVPKGPRGSTADNTESLTTAAEQALDEAQKQLAEAYKALTGNVEARAEFEKKAINDEAASQQA